MRRLSLALVPAGLILASNALAFTWPNTTERVEKALASSDEAARRDAARRLLDLPDAAAKRLVRRALKDADDEVRLAAAEAALELRIEDAGELVTPWLNDSERRIRLAAAGVLRVSPTDHAVAPLGRVLSDPDAEVRVTAAEALGTIGTSSAVVPLLGHLDDTTPRVRVAVVDALGRLGDARAAVPLIGKIQDARADVRRSVARSLGEIGDARAVSALVLSLRDAAEDVRVAAVEALGRLGSDVAVPPILGLLDDEERSAVRNAALRALAEIRSERAVESLIDALESDDAASRRVAREALADVGPSAIPRLRACLVGQPRPRRADGCVAALGSIREGVDPGIVVGALRRGVVGPGVALGALAALRQPGGLPTVLEHLSDPDPFVRRSAMDAAFVLLDPSHPDGRAVGPVRRALEAARKSKLERSALASLLGRTGSPRAAEPLVLLAAAESDPSLRIAAIEALGRLGPAGQDGVLLRALESERPSVRLAAAIALQRSASGKSAAILLDRLDERAEQDRAAILIALGGALARSRDRSIWDRTFRRLAASRGGERDALLEALGRSPAADVGRRLGALARSTASIADRAKIAEALAGRASAKTSLLALARDVDGSVRANAVWALGTFGRRAALAVLVAALGDRDVAVAGNAAAAIGRVGARDAGAKAVEHLCRALADSRSYVRANALAALGLVGARCGDGSIERALLANDRSAVVREAASALCSRVPSKRGEEDRRALARCAERDRVGSVAASCAGRPGERRSGSEPVSVYVVPMGESLPAPRAPFALVLADGLMRLGLTDRRGEVFEAEAPRGEVSLAVPAPLAR